MADEIINSENILVEFNENNIILCDPNKVVKDGKPEARLARHENLVIYANLRAKIVPRSKIIVGDAVQAESFVDLFDGEVSFLREQKAGQPRQYMTSDWTEQFTNPEVNQQKVVNTTDPNTQQQVPRVQIDNKLDTGSFGIESIQISMNSAWIPTVTINFVDVRGKTLFEQGANSPYSVFFHMPYPLFLLTIKGFYGKAVTYQLMMHKFNASFDPGSGNYKVTCNFVGRTYALLSDITAAEILNAPYMYSRTYDFASEDDENKKSLVSTRGYQTMKEIYQIYKRKDILPDALPELTISELVQRIDSLEKAIEEGLDDVEMDSLDDVKSYEAHIDSLRARIIGPASWSYRNMATTEPPNYTSIGTGALYYTWKDKIGEDPQKRKDSLDELKTIISEGVGRLEKNATFGIGKKVNIDGKKQTLKIDVDISFEDIFLGADTIDGAPENVEYFLFTLDPNSFDEKLANIYEEFNKKRQSLEKDVSKRINAIVESDKGLGFSPTIRNVFGMLCASVDTFLRLMDDVHTDSMSVRDDKKRLEVVNTMGTTSVEPILPKDNFVYPWPSYYVRQENENGGQDFVLTYPAARSVIRQTEAYKFEKWPEVGFVEEYLRASTLRGKTPNLGLDQESGESSGYGPVTAIGYGLDENFYDNISQAPFMYEIYDRSVMCSFFSGINTRLASDSSLLTMRALGGLESVNISKLSTTSYNLQEKLKNQNFDYQTFLDYLREISPLTNWPLLVRNNYSTPYIREEILERNFSITSIDDFKKYRNRVKEDDSLTLIKKFISKPKIRNDKQIYDTYPFVYPLDPQVAVGDWIKNNLANCEAQSGYVKPSYQEFYNIDKNIDIDTEFNKYGFFTDTQLKIDGNKTQNSTYYTDNFFKNWTSLISRRNELITPGLYANWPKYYKDTVLGWNTLGNTTKGKNQLRFLTEGKITYKIGAGVPETDSPGVETEFSRLGTQIASMLNTPYFTNAIKEGTINEMNDSPYAYKNAAFLFVNSLPVPTTREKLLESIDDVNIINDRKITYGDYAFANLNQLAAVHRIPYAWILKYGALWHRYKQHVNFGTDTLTSVWKDFDAAKAFNPNSVAPQLSHQYTLSLGNGGTQILFSSERPIGGNFEKIDLGFYPEMINLTNYFVTGSLLFSTNYTSPEIDFYINNDLLNVKRSDGVTILANPGFDTSNPQRDMSCSFWYSYYDMEKDSLYSGHSSSYLLYPSTGGLKYAQTKNEFFDSVGTLKKEIYGSKSTHNGATRFAWGLSPYGFFEHNETSFPPPDRYIKKIDTKHNSQDDFDILFCENDNECYDTIEEIFDIFDDNILDNFEEYFLNFSSSSSKFNNNMAGLNPGNPNSGTTITTPYGNFGSGDIKNFQSLMRSFIILEKDRVGAPSNNSTDFGKQLANAQTKKLHEKLKLFLGINVALRLSNPNQLDLLSLRSFVGETDYYDFGTYGYNLPPDITLAASETSNTLEFRALRTKLGFFSDDFLKYSDTGSYVFDFFRVMDVEFSTPNIERLYTIIRQYITYVTLNGPITRTEFIGYLSTGLDDLYQGQIQMLEETFLKVKEVMPDTPEEKVGEFQSMLESDEQKLELYLQFQTLNNKWISGTDVQNKTIFEDFMFLDRANRDIGSTAIMDVYALKSFTNPENAGASFYNLLGSLLDSNYFLFLPLPTYINFYGTQTVNNEALSRFTSTEEANSLFGTHLEVDTVDTGPKFICMYVGERSQHPDMQTDQYRYKTDSFLLGRTADNPLFNVCDNPGKCNKVVAFAVDFGLENQNMFKGISLDQADFQNTSETFSLTQQIADSQSGRDIATQGTSLFNVYRSRSYTCKVEAMGNATIQPTMYFMLRHVPMFNGPYLITKVTHSITPNDMNTSFEGVRSPFYKLPDISNLVARVNKSYLNRVKKKREIERSQGGFNPEGTKYTDPPGFTSSSKPGPNGSIRMIVVHVTAGEDYGPNPVIEINRQHINRGFSGIGYHYLISRGTGGSQPDGVIMAGRPSDKVGAHTRGKNSISYGISMVANCAKKGTYDSTPTGTNPYATTAQKESLVNLLVYLLFKSRILIVVYGQAMPGLLRDESGSTLRIFFPDDTDQEHKQADTNPIPVSYLKKVIYGHNQFASKRCPCFKVPDALNGNFGTDLQNKIMEYMSAAVSWTTSYGDSSMKIDAKGNPLNETEATSFYTDNGFTYLPFMGGWTVNSPKPVFYKDGDFTWENRRDIT